MSRAGVLIVDPSLEHTRFVEDALAEAGETRATPLTLSSFHLQHAEDAVHLLESEPCDALLFGVEEAGRAVFDTFLALRSAAPLAALIPMVPAQERDFGRTLLRRGAQDFLIRFEFDHISLARAIENSIERQRFLSAAESCAVFDSATGLLNRKGFLFLAGRLGWRPAFLTICELGQSVPEPQKRDTILLEAAEALRVSAGEAALVARWTEDRFVVLSRTLEHVAPPELRAVSIRLSGAGDLDSAFADAERQLS